ncbi:hypothetical protein HGO37_14070 [Rhizobium sp. CG4]|jgi:hypothetical protein|uniref:hypothetical protein n=1 Tax=Rhizobium sp. CG4 TaxID=2726075 RepID=UPI002033EB51|nr:hypothetical protein [Rhizobium sp. CG4]MCM2456513.1 hypothetical protein [Rhizobium sp. CG4]
MKYAILISVILMSAPPAFTADFSHFDAETKAVSQAIKCPTPNVTRTPGLPDLWGCIFPGAEVMKVFINATDDGNSVENVKIMWNDWTRDTGYGVHTDKGVAEAWVMALSSRYAPTKVQEILAAFRGTSPVTIEGDGVNLTYTHFKGPAIDERLITVTPH